jgi:sugar phosphate isomerase/epimerase
MANHKGRRLSVSTWSLHRTLGRPRAYGPGQELPPHSPQGLDLLELPARLAAFGIHTLEICHFHLPTRDRGYLAELHGAMLDAGVEPFTLLIDAGDVTDPVHGERDLAWISGWLDDAAALGVERARVIAGKSPPSEDGLATSVRALRQLATRAQEVGVRLTTENWLALMASPSAVFRVLDALDRRLGLCVDFGNWRHAQKYDDLAQLMPRAESFHAKCHFGEDGAMDRADFVQCLELARDAENAGPYTLIYDGPNADEWAGLDAERAIVTPYLNS